MTASRDPDRLIHHFLLEGEEQLRDQVYDAVRAAIERKRQRVIFGPWRTPVMYKIVGFGLAAAAVVVALVVGTQLLGSPTTNVGGPDVEASPTPEASVAEPSATASPAPADGSLPEGAHVLYDGTEGGVPISVTIPAPGWYGEPGGGVVENSGESNFGPDDAGMIGPFVGDIYVPADPCRWRTTMPDTPATTVDAVVAALQAQASRNASEPVDITVDGHAGQSITLRVPDEAVFGECDEGEGEAKFCTLTEDDPRICHRFNQFPGQIDEVWILDVNGEVMVFDAGWGDETPAEDLAELRAILESMTFEAP